MLKSQEIVTLVRSIHKATLLPLLVSGLGVLRPAAAAPPPNPILWIGVACEGDFDAERRLELAVKKFTSMGWDVRELMAQFPRHPCPLHPQALEQTVEKAKTLFHEVKLPLARKLIVRTLARLTDQTLTEDGVDHWRELLIYLGWIDLELESETAASESFSILAQLWPTWRPDPQRFPPAVIAAHERSRDLGRSESRSSVEVESEPPGARVALNGVRRCVAPCRLTELGPRQNFIHGTLEGFAPTTIRLSSPDPTQPVVLELKPSPRAPLLSTTTQDADLVATVRALAPGAMATVLIPSPEPGTPSTTVSTGKLGLVRSLEGSRVEEQVDRWTETVGIVAAQAADPRKAETLGAQVAEGSPRITSRWWFWAATGAAALGLGATVAYLATRDRADTVVIVVRP